ncbi:MAG: hypothetical protein V3S89_03665 [Desulfobacterales bacterium]
MGRKGLNRFNLLPMIPRTVELEHIDSAKQLGFGREMGLCMGSQEETI